MRSCQDDPLLKVGSRAEAPTLERFAAAASSRGRRLVVGALVTDGAGRIYVQRRSLTRAVFPGCWDLVGGHVEPGEEVVEALARELREETGWSLAEVGPVVEVLDWEAGGVARSEVDFLVTVSGDLARPRLEPDKHSEGRWLAADELGVLLEGRLPDDRWVHDVVARGFGVLRGTWAGGLGSTGRG